MKINLKEQDHNIKIKSLFFHSYVLLFFICGIIIKDSSYRFFLS